MQEQIKQIAERIKGLREIFEVSPETLAGELDVPIDTYRDYESGRVDIPVSILFKISHRFHVEMSTLLTGEEPRLHTYALTRRDKGITVARRADYKYQSLAHNFIHKKAEFFIVTVEPEAEDAPVHYNSHPGQEFDYVLTGELKIVLNGYEVILGEGDSLFYDSGTDHGMKALSGKPAKFLAVIL